MNNKETLQNYNSKLNINNSDLLNILQTINNLPNAGGEEITLQEKTVTPTTSNQNIVADNGYNGLSKVTINGVTSAIDSDIQSSNIKKGINILGVTGTLEEYVEPSLQSKTASPKTTSQTITADSGYDGLSEVIINKVTSSIDSNIKETNIKKGISILGVTGTLEEGSDPVLQEKTVSPSTSQQNIVADSSYDGLSKVTVNAVTNSIDSNIKASNIKKNVSILGITGTLEEGIIPSGTLNITTNGTHNVTNYANANVNVASGGDTTLEDGLASGSLTTYTNTRITKLNGGCFSHNDNLISVSLPSVTTIEGT